MGRKPRSDITESARIMDVAVRREKEHELAVQDIDRLYLPEGETYNLYLVTERARFYQTQAATSLIELGKQVLLLKAHEPYGQFLLAIENLGMAERSARYAMAAAEKFANRHTCADLGNAKVRALTVLDDDSIKRLEDGGEVAGLGTLDEIERMTVKELKAALRSEKKKRTKEREAQEAAISQKEQKLNELEHELRYQAPPTAAQLAQLALDELQKPLFGHVMQAWYHLDKAVEQVVAAQNIQGVEFGQLQTWAMEHYKKLADLQAIYDELDEALSTICPDGPRGDGPTIDAMAVEA